MEQRNYIYVPITYTVHGDACVTRHIVKKPTGACNWISLSAASWNCSADVRSDEKVHYGPAQICSSRAAAAAFAL